MENSEQMDAAAIEKIESMAVSAIKPYIGPQDEHVIIVPEGYKHFTLKPEAELPKIIEYSKVFVHNESFIDYVNKYKNPDTVLFQSVGCNSFTAIIDFHNKETAGWHKHKVGFTPRLSDEWQIWAAIEGKRLEQTEFLEFIEENLPDVVKPLGADLLTVAANFEGLKKVDFKSATRLSDGQVQFRYEETIENGGKGDLKMPTELELEIPVYVNDDAYSLVILLRHRIHDGGLAFIMKRHRPEKLINDAFDLLAKEIAKQINIKPYLI